jgi:hypothetical protein
MPEDYDWKERRNQVERYRILEQETTDPIAARLLHDIVLDLEAEFKGSPQSYGLDAAYPSTRRFSHKKPAPPAAASSG